MSVHAENKHWNPADHLFSLGWSTHVVLSPFFGQEITSDQQKKAAEYVAISDEMGVRSIDIMDVDSFLGRIGITLMVEGDNEEKALRNATMAYLSGLNYAGVDIEDLEFVGGHLAFEGQLQEDAARDPGRDITHDDYRVDVEAREAFRQLSPVFRELAALTK